jgi:catechol 2,3-dioxygenase-like lactoylglutathione lyase family enzyme
MTNLENLRKQAKQLVRWHREREWTVAHVIRETLTRYDHLCDGQILDAEFRLADAQELVARRAGFRDWESLVAASHTDADAAAGSEFAAGASQRPVVLTARPFLFVSSVEAACAYYVDKLGFTLVFSYGKPAYYAEIQRDGVDLCIRHIDVPMIDPALATREEIVMCGIKVSDAKAFYLELQYAGAILAQTLRTEPYGVRTFVAADPDGNRILFFDTPRQPEAEETGDGG